MKRLFLVAIAACSAERMAIEQAPIIGPAHPAAVGEWPATGALLDDDLGFPTLECTGTLIAPGVVLTAAHCVDSVATSGGIPSFTFERYAHAADPTKVIAGARAVAHPDWHANVPPGQLDQANDIGLLFLAQPVTDVAPALLPRASDAAAIVTGLPVTLVGYGYNDGAYQDAGVPGYESKMVGASHVVATAAWEIELMGPGEAHACDGDSGGPAYAMLGDAHPRIAATVSRGMAFMDCSKGDIYTRVDPYVAWIAGQVALPCDSGPSPACPRGDDAGVPDAPTDPATPDAPGAPDHGPGGGCGCRSNGSPGLAVLLVAGLLRRRRRFTFRGAD